MKENKYDDIKFFEKYSQMARSTKGLAGAGEWWQLKELLPNLENKKMLDLGCGFGWHCIYAMENGAEKVVGVDISTKMLEKAKAQTPYKNVEYICSAIEDLTFSENTFDIVLSSLTFHYIKDFNEVVKNIHKFLKDGGDFVFSVEHPIFTAQGKQDWNYDENGKIKDWPVDNYYYEGKRESIFLGEKVIKYHRTLTTYVETLIKNGFRIEHIVEAQPSEEMRKSIPGMEDEMRRPMMLLISAKAYKNL